MEEAGSAEEQVPDSHEMHDGLGLLGLYVRMTRCWKVCPLA